MGKNIIDIKNLKMFGQDYIKILTVLLKKHRKNASGALINSINYRVKEDIDSALIEIEANDYLINVDQGRKPGKYPPVREIAKWCKLKGIPQGAAFPIARSIFKFGIQPTNILREVSREFETSATLKNKYENKIGENLEQFIIQNIYNQTKQIKK